MEKPHVVALNKQLALIRFWRSPYGQKFGGGYEMSLRSKGQATTAMHHNKTLANWQADRLDQTETYWAADEMISLVEHAAQTYPDEPLLETDLPTRSGFVYMEKGRYMIDRHGDQLGQKVFTWWVTTERRNGPTGQFDIPGVEVAIYSDPKDTGDTNLAKMPAGSLDGQPLSLAHVAFWPFDYTIDNLMEGSQEYLDTDEGRDMDYRAFGDAMFMMAFLKTFWRLIQQRIMTIHTHRADRPTARRAQRSGFLADTDDIKVITLRRFREPQPDIPDTEGQVVEWSHRWLVEGHWRNQFYPSIGLHRQIYISPFVKGPEDRPLIIKDKVFKWTR